jgi:hypothetical protein
MLRNSECEVLSETAELRGRHWAAQATRIPIVVRHVSGAQSAVAHAQLSVAHPAGRASHANETMQPPRQPGCPLPGQLGVALVPAGQTPPSAGVHVGAVQSW